MMGRTHMMFGFAGGLAILPPVTDLSGGGVLAGAVAASWFALLPDVDARKSRLSAHLLTRPLRWLFVLYTWVVRALPGKHAKEWVCHRGITHTLVFAALLHVVLTVGAWALSEYRPNAPDLAWLPWVVSVGVVVGHLAPDCLTDSGCPLLFPVTRRRFRLATISTGKAVERWAVVPLVGLGIFAELALLAQHAAPA